MRVPHQLIILSTIGLAACGVIRVLPEANNSSFNYSSIGSLSSAEETSPFADELSAGLIDDVEAALAQTDVIASDDLNTGEGSLGEDDGEMLIQEPSRRSSRRPSVESPSKYNQRASYAMLKAFGEALGDTWKSTVELVMDDERMAYGAIVDADGWIISKESQLPSGKLICRFADGNESLAEVVERSPTLDLALIRVPDKGLSVVRWAESGIPARGNWVATPNIQSIPAAVGVVSAGLMTISSRRAVMGVQLKEDKGPVVQSVVYGSGADIAGLLPGDRIRTIDGRSLSSQAAALEFLATCRAGQSVKLTVQRGDSEVETRVRMMDFSEDLRDETEMEVNGLISARSSGFSSIYMHDTVLKPNQCGGPLVDLNGQVVGINIARAGRVSSYALPVSVVREEINRLLPKAKGNHVVTASVATPGKVVSEK